MSGQITVPEPTAEEKAYFNKLQAAGPNTAVGGGFGFATTVLLVKRMQNKLFGSLLPNVLCQTHTDSSLSSSKLSQHP